MWLLKIVGIVLMLIVLTSCDLTTDTKQVESIAATRDSLRDTKHQVELLRYQLEETQDSLIYVKRKLVYTEKVVNTLQATPRTQVSRTNAETCEDKTVRAMRTYENMDMAETMEMMADLLESC